MDKPIVFTNQRVMVMSGEIFEINIYLFRIFKLILKKVG